MHLPQLDEYVGGGTKLVSSRVQTEVSSAGLQLQCPSVEGDEAVLAVPMLNVEKRASRPGRGRRRRRSGLWRKQAEEECEGELDG